ncbi:MAG: biotin--[acetyl-CoA-carboxylase] ligase [Acidimicrobiales bacterium]
MASITWRLEIVESLGSTNAWLAAEARQGAPEGRAVLAYHQTEGRGRLGRSWEERPGSALLVSVLLRPASLAGVAWSTAIVSLAARDALARLAGVRPSLKWPNDLLVGDEKLGGVLAQLVETDPVGVVVGLGVNLTAHPAGVGATNVRHCAGVTLDPVAECDLLFEGVEQRRAALDDGEGRELLRTQYERALATIGRDVRVVLADQDLVGRAVGVDAEGRLRVDTGDGVRVLAAGDVNHVRWADVS